MSENNSLQIIDNYEEKTPAGVNSKGRLMLKALFDEEFGAVTFRLAYSRICMARAIAAY